MKTRTIAPLALIAFGLALALPATVGARAAIPTTVFFDNTEPTANPDVLTFNGHVASPKAKCRNHRKLVISKRPSDSTGGFTFVTSTTTNSTAKWTKNLNVTGGPDFQVKAPRKRFGRPGHRKTCAANSILLEAT
jgi:hypothetical protein